MCAGCFRRRRHLPADLHPCPGCDSVWYCSEACRRDDLGFHRLLCAQLAAARRTEEAEERAAYGGHAAAPAPSPGDVVVLETDGGLVAGPRPSSSELPEALGLWSLGDCDICSVPFEELGFRLSAAYVLEKAPGFAELPANASLARLRLSPQFAFRGRAILIDDRLGLTPEIVRALLAKAPAYHAAGRC